MGQQVVRVILFLGLVLYCHASGLPWHYGRFFRMIEQMQDTRSSSREVTSPLTTHILDTSRGLPAANVPIALSIQTMAGFFTELERGSTDDDGRGGFLGGVSWQPGTYKLHFDTGSYFAQRNVEGFYPYAEIVFIIKDTRQHYHVPLLLSPFSYSTYRGS